ncbi:MAG TPA: hypothetical protein VMS74_13800 [Acidimicrobiia bacterium]|nr:hypothetical protein [Acidimicrobiia bacterium]
MTEVVALFANRADAESAVRSLESMGFDAETMGYLNRHEEDRDFDMDTTDRMGTDRESEAAKGAAGGAVGGAAVGAGAGLLAAAGVALIPGIGPFLAAGTLLGTLGATAAGAAGGAVLGGAAGAIFGDDGDDDEYATYYREGVNEGGSLVTVHVDDDMSDRVQSTLRDMGAKRVDVHDDDRGWVV